MTPDTDAYIEAGGHAEHLTLYRAMGRIAPFSDGDSRALATIHDADPTIGAIGDWVGDDTVRIAAENWLRSQGCVRVRGPMELSSWFRWRACLGPYDDIPFQFEPTEAAERWLVAGYQVAREYLSLRADNRPQIALGRDRAAALSARGWTLQTLPESTSPLEAGAFRELIGLFHGVYHDAFQDRYGCLPVTETALAAWYEPYRTAVDTRLTRIAYTPDRDVAGFLLALTDVNDPRHFLIHTLAVLPAHQRMGVGSWLVAATHSAADRLGYTAGIHAMIPADRPGRLDARLIRRYALLEKRL